MKLIDEEPWRWMLFEDNGDLYLDVLCSHSAVDYRFAISLDAQEKSDLKQFGRDSLSRLAHEIHYSAPGVIGNSSEYRERRVSDALANKIREATK